MLKTISIFILIFAFCSGAFAQTEKYTAPVKWERYRVSDKEVSILFPKLPVFIKGYADVCSDEENKEYAAYAEGIVYGLRIVSNIKQRNLDNCSRTKTFGEKNFNDRLKEIKSSLKTEEISLNRNNYDTIKINGEFLTYWLINDFKNKRWFEVWVTDKDETDSTVKNFVESFKIEKNPSGIEIGQGAERSLGDELAVESDVVDEQKATSEKDLLKGVRIISKPVPKYTDAARQQQIKGIVRLRVTFLANGGIGNIEALSELPYGLTEQAVAAAKKIVFVPAKRNEKNISLARALEYSFSIH